MEPVKQPIGEKQNKKHKRKRGKSQSLKAKKKNNSGKDLLPTQGKVTPKSSLPAVDIKKIKEPFVKCGYCDKVIKNIANAIKGDDCYYHFDCVLEKIKDDYKVTDKQKVSYIGRGSFAIIENDAEGKMEFVETIQIENPQQFDAMKKYIEEIKE